MVLHNFRLADLLFKEPSGEILFRWVSFAVKSKIVNMKVAQYGP